MNEIKISHLFNQDMVEFSASRLELGDNAGRITWNNSVSETKNNPLPINHDEARDWLSEFGAWTEQELRDMSDNEINALILQFIAGDIREIESTCSNDKGEIDWLEYEEQSQAGRISSNIFRAEDGEVYFSMYH